MNRILINNLTSPKQTGWSIMILPLLLAVLMGIGLLSISGCSSDGESSPNGPGGSAPKPLTVVSISPANGTVGISVTTPVVVTFSSTVDPATVNNSTFMVQGVSGSYNVSGAVVTFTPNSNLAENTTYSVTLTTVIADTKGNNLEQNVAVSFATAARPQASAGNDMTVNRNEMVMLSATTNIANPVYEWRQLAGESVGSLNGATPSFMSPSQVGTLAFELIIKDGSSNSSPDTVFVFVLENKNASYWVHPSGDDANNGTRTAPFQSIQRAINQAVSVNADVYVAAGTFYEQVALADGVSIYGGFNPNNWQREISANATIITGSSTAVIGVDVSHLALNGLTIIAIDAVDPGASSIGLSLARSQGLDITKNNITAGKGVDGSNGTQPVRPAKANDGSNGTGAGGCIPANEGGSGGSGSGRAGGDGGNGGAAGGFDGGGGAGPCGDAGGGRFANSGTNGDDGCTGSIGADATTPGPEFGSIVSGVYLTADGKNGTAGSTGGGGGGGGGGAGSLIGCGGGGGGGGAGGLGGGAGRAGLGGGASIGILLSENSSGEIVDNVITTSNGGDGGYGSLGGLGGLGGDYGSGGGSNASGWAGGRGGNGGTGGTGGIGSGGGGGPSIGIVEHASTSVQDHLTFELGTPGLGGARPDGLGTKGLDGERAEVKKIQ